MYKIETERKRRFHEKVITRPRLYVTASLHTRISYLSLCLVSMGGSQFPVQDKMGSERDESLSNLAQTQIS